MYRHFSENDAEALLIQSEKMLSKHKGENSGHALARHSLLSNKDLDTRAGEKLKNSKNNEIYAISAFAQTEKGEIARALQQVLNSNIAQQAIRIFRVHNLAQDGMRAVINHLGRISFNGRFASMPGMGTRLIKTHFFCLVLERHDGALFGLHVQTFYCQLSSAPQDSMRLYRQNGGEIKEF